MICRGSSSHSSPSGAEAPAWGCRSCNESSSSMEARPAPGIAPRGAGGSRSCFRWGPPKTARTPTVPRERILVVDDEPAVRFGVRDFLDSQGYLVDEADSGEAALQR